MSNHFKLSRRTLITGAGAIGVGSAVAGAGTLAVLDDQETSGSHSLQAGVVDLKQGTTATISFTSSDIGVGDSGSDYANVETTADHTLTSDLSVGIFSYSNSEGTNPEPEGDTTSPGNLGNQLDLKFWLGLGGASDTTFDDSTDIGLKSDGSTTTSNDGGFESADNYDGVNWPDVITGFTGPVTLNVAWQWPQPSYYDENDAMGDKVSFDISFTLTQQ